MTIYKSQSKVLALKMWLQKKSKKIVCIIILEGMHNEEEGLIEIFEVLIGGELSREEGVMKNFMVLKCKDILPKSYKALHAPTLLPATIGS